LQELGRIGPGVKVSQGTDDATEADEDARDLGDGKEEGWIGRHVCTSFLRRAA
jgi:hypothetical protein